MLSLVRPTLEYVSAAWDPSTTEDITKLERFQRPAARFAHCNYHDRTPGCVTKIFNDLGWEPRQIQRVLAETDTDDIIRPSDKRLYKPAVTVSVYNNSLFQRTLQEWNTLPTSVTDATTLEEFCNGLGLAQPALQS